MKPDKSVHLPWNKVQPGQKVRFSTSNFVRYGHVLERRGVSMILQLQGEEEPRVIPWAQDYWERPSDDEWHLTAIKGKGREAKEFGPPTPEPTELTFEEAQEFLHTDAKTLRRWLRREIVTGRKEGDRWVAVDADSARARRRTLDTR